MSERSGGFTSMADAKATGTVPEVGVGMLGYAFMGKAHSHAMLTIPHMMYPPPAIPKLAAIAGRNEEAVKEAAKRYGYQRYYTSSFSTTAAPLIPTPNRALPQPRRASMFFAKSRWGALPMNPNGCATK